MQPSRFLVTGGSQGIGAAIVEQARQAGHPVVFTGRNKELIDAMARKTGAVGLQADVSVAEENARTVDACTERMGGVDVLVYAADIADTIMAALNMPRRALWPELAVFANNPWKE